MNKIRKNEILTFWISLYLLLLLLIIRFNKITYSIKEFGFQIRSFADFAFIILAVLQDFFFCFFIFLFIFGFFCISYGSFLSTKYVLKYHDKINFKNIEIPHKTFLIVITFVLFF